MSFETSRSDLLHADFHPTGLIGTAAFARGLWFLQFDPILGDTRTRLVAAYVWSLSHAEPGAAAPRQGTE